MTPHSIVWLAACAVVLRLLDSGAKNIIAMWAMRALPGIPCSGESRCYISDLYWKSLWDSCACV